MLKLKILWVVCLPILSVFWMKTDHRMWPRLTSLPPQKQMPMRPNPCPPPQPKYSLWSSEVPQFTSKGFHLYQDNVAFSTEDNSTSSLSSKNPACTLEEGETERQNEKLLNIRPTRLLTFILLSTRLHVNVSNANCPPACPVAECTLSVQWQIISNDDGHGPHFFSRSNPA